MKWQILTTFTMALQIPEAALSEYWPCAIILSKSSSRSTKFHHKVHRVPILISTPKFHDIWLTRRVAKSEPLSSYHPYHSWTQAYVAEWICRHKFDQLSSQCINMWCQIDLNPILFQQITRLKNILCDAVLFFFLFQDLNISYFFLSFIILAYRIVLHLFIWVNWSVLYMLEHLVLLKMYWFHRVVVTSCPTSFFFIVSFQINFHTWSYYGRSSIQSYHMKYEALVSIIYQVL